MTEFRVCDHFNYRTLPLNQYQQNLIGKPPDKFPFVIDRISWIALC